MTFRELSKKAKNIPEGLNKVKIAILADHASQYMATAFAGAGIDQGFHLEVYEAPYDQVETEVFNLQSQLYQYNPDYIFLSFSTHKLIKKFYKTELGERHVFADQVENKISGLLDHLKQHLQVKIILSNYYTIIDNVFGNYALNTIESFEYQIQRLNVKISEITQSQQDIYCLNTAHTQSIVGYNSFFDSKYHINAGIAYSLEALPQVADQFVQIIASVKGKINKCIILDLDNTLWGGIIGDDGLENIELGNLGIGESFVDFQLWLKELQRRGIILCVCSKNDEKIAKEPFVSHPDMVLKLDDIAVFMANWNNKADNINKIQSVLNIGFDSMIFIDDNPFEREMVREHIAGITVPDMPEDPVEYLSYLQSLNLFDTASYSGADAQRTKQYQQEAVRAKQKDSFIDEKSFLESLNMKAEIKIDDKFSIPRIAQLTQRSNQFNLTTKRYSEGDIETIVNDPEKHVFTLSVSDKYGDYGLVSIAIIHFEKNNAVIDSWIMSCRVLTRGVEQFFMNHIIDHINNKGCEKVEGLYFPTAKNKLVRNFYIEMGFLKKEENRFLLKIKNYKKITTQIKYYNEG